MKSSRVMFGRCIVSLCLLALLALTACQSALTKPAAPMPPPDPNALKVGVSTNAPPLIYKQGGEITGLEAELAQGLAKFTGKTVQFVVLPWNDQIPALLDKRIDIIMSGMSVTNMRQMRIAFGTPYFRSGQMALTRKKYSHRLGPGFFAIKGQSMLARIGVIENTTGEFFVRRNFSNARGILTYETSMKAVQALIDSRIDIFIHDAPVVLMMAAENQNRQLTPIPSLLTEEYLAWGIRKNDVELLDAANRFVENGKQSGKLDEIVKRWIPYTSF